MGTKEYHKQYYKANKDKWYAYNTKEKRDANAVVYYLNHKDKVLERKRLYNEHNYEGVLFRSARTRAKHASIYFDLIVEDIVIPEVCPLLEIPLTRIQGQGVVWTNASIDRIDNDLGYTKDNIQVISRMANSMKQHASKEQLLAFARNTLKLYE